MNITDLRARVLALRDRTEAELTDMDEGRLNAEREDIAERMGFGAALDMVLGMIDEKLT